VAFCANATEAIGPQSVKSTLSSLASFLDHALAAKVHTESDECPDLAKIARRRFAERSTPKPDQAAMAILTQSGCRAECAAVWASLTAFALDP
jgi:hypothetical protein